MRRAGPRVSPCSHGDDTLQVSARGGEVVVDLEERDLRRAGDPDFLAQRTNLLLRELLEHLRRLPDVDDAEAALGLGHAMKDPAGGTSAARPVPHLDDEL